MFLKNIYLQFFLSKKYAFVELNKHFYWYINTVTLIQDENYDCIKTCLEDFFIQIGTLLLQIILSMSYYRGSGASVSGIKVVLGYKVCRVTLWRMLAKEFIVLRE